MQQTKLTRSEAIEEVLDEWADGSEYEEGMEARHNAILDEYLDSDEFKEEMAEARAEILSSYEASDEFKENMAKADVELRSEYRDYLETLPDNDLAEQACAEIVPDDWDQEEDCDEHD